MGEPRLVNPKNFEIIPVKPDIPTLKIQNTKKLNIILFLAFILFTCFFLYNCKYGIFKSIPSEPMPFSMVYNLT